MNKKVRASRSRYVSDLLAEPLPSAKPTKSRIRQLESRSRELDDEITRLECSIAAAPVAMRQRRLATRNTLPAPEPTFSRTKRTANGRVPQVQRRARRNARMGKLVELLVVFGVLAAALGWMNQWLHWWN
ncbi:hypothetical protein [Brevifollis gellanilyticus]|uniref:Uncharacterized protein n=1 Tax=Brevifollis gellanilyticus TaxID=748831 RepID=A0A512MFU0_9BACT|nr:hypothetical protein [Brevifollis gellanilyticus]GEP45566.1 hypothetical protein BGE01nite_48570 [Brevifollis gellanilyticus]